MTSDPSPQYTNPPINEVVCGAAFAPLERFKIPHLGLFWHLILEQFPRCEQVPPLGNFEEVFEQKLGILPPRVWFINQNDDRLIQLQKNRFLFNWRKRTDSYPHFPHIYESFSNNFDRFQRFIAKHNIGEIKVGSYELTYINLLLKGEGWEDLDHIHMVFPNMTWRRGAEDVLPPTRNFVWQRALSLPDHPGTLTLKLQNGVRKTDQHPLLRMEFSIRGPTDVQPSEGMSQWFDNAHKWIIRAFEETTAPDVQKNVWGKIC
jgi:uncharacterized protein (TIGR04255 family)